MIAIHDARGTRSCGTGPASRATSSGAMDVMADASASCMVEMALKKKMLDAVSNAPRAI